MLKSRLVAGLLAAFCFSATAHAADSYYVVVPVKGKGEAVAPAPALDIKLVLNSATLPDIYQDVPYQFDIKPLLVATGDPNFTIDGVTWSGAAVGQSTLSMRADGTLSGTLTGRPMGFNVPVTATYKGVAASKTYFVRLQPLTVNLSAAALPSANAGQAYTFDFRPLLSVSYPQFVATSDTFKLGPVPVAGISLSTTTPGQLQVSASVPAGVYTIPLTATYYSRTSSVDYTLTVQAPGYAASKFVPSKSGTIDTLVNTTGETITVTNCQRTPPGGTATACTAKDAWPAGWPSGIGMQGVNPSNTYRISLANGQTIVWVPESATVSMQ